jgi:hypothetical protein
MREVRNAFESGSLNGRGHVGDLHGDGRIILK